MLIALVTYALFLCLYFVLKSRNTFVVFATIGAITIGTLLGLTSLRAEFAAYFNRDQGVALSAMYCGDLGEKLMCFSEVNDRRATAIVASEQELAPEEIDLLRSRAKHLKILLEPREIEVTLIVSNVATLRREGIFDTKEIRQESYGHISF